jgi:hypothetical protein
MYEDRPERDTPEEVQQLLEEYGGKSPDGQPIWRMVRAENRRILCFGTMNHISVDVSQLPELGRPTDVVPDRIEEGVFWVPRYEDHVEGWILERWFPASAWGSREKWEGERAKDGRTKLLAAYPQRGDYMMMPCGPWKTIVEAGDLKGAIRCYNIQQRRNPVSWVNHQNAMLAFEAQQRQQKAEAYAEEIAAQHRLGLEGILRSVSTSAQEFRNAVARQTAGGINLGASEKWG